MCLRGKVNTSARLQLERRALFSRYRLRICKLPWGTESSPIHQASRGHGGSKMSRIVGAYAKWLASATVVLVCTPVSPLQCHTVATHRESQHLRGTTIGYKSPHKYMLPKLSMCRASSRAHQANKLSAACRVKCSTTNHKLRSLSTRPPHLGVGIPPRH